MVPEKSLPKPDSNTVTDTLTIDKPSTSNILGKPYQVIMFNDSSHSIEEVSNQVIKAIHCGKEKAMSITMEAHLKGRASVFTGNKERCELVAAVLEEIRLGTKIEPV